MVAQIIVLVHSFKRVPFTLFRLPASQVRQSSSDLLDLMWILFQASPVTHLLTSQSLVNKVNWGVNRRSFENDRLVLEKCKTYLPGRKP